MEQKTSSYKRPLKYSYLNKYIVITTIKKSYIVKMMVNKKYQPLTIDKTKDKYTPLISTMMK